MIHLVSILVPGIRPMNVPYEKGRPVTIGRSFTLKV